MPLAETPFLATLTGVLILACAAPLLLVPGRARLLAAAMTAPAAAAVLGTAGVLYGAIGLPFTAASALVPLSAAFVCGGAAVLVRRSHGVERPLGYPHLVVAVSAAASVAVLAVILAVSTWGGLSLTYDGLFHLSAAAAVLQTGEASSLDLYEISNPGEAASDFYPAAWHSLVALIAGVTGADVITSTAGAVTAVAVAAWIPGIVFLTDAMFPHVRHRTTLRAAAAVLASCFAPFPYLLIDWGTLYPSFFAYALLPAGLGVLVLLLRGSRPRLLTALLTVWLVAAVFSHPRSLPTFAVLATPLVISTLVQWLLKLLRDPVTRRRGTALTAASLASLVVGLPLMARVVFGLFDTPGRPVADRLNGGPATANQSLAGALGQALGLGPVVSPTETAVAPSLLLSATVSAGVVLCLRRPQLVWVPVSWAAIIVLYTLAASSDTDVAKILTGLWYKDKYRLIAALPIVAAPLAAYALAAVARLAARHRVPPLFRPAMSAAIVLTVAATSWFGPTLAGVGAATRSVFLPPTASDPARIDTDALALLARLRNYVPEGQRVLGNPWTGATLTGPISGREAVFPHLTGDWNESRIVLAQRLDEAEVDLAVCSAAEELDVSYVFAAEGVIGGGDDAAIAFYAGIDRAVAASDVLTEVAREGDAALYELTACE